MSTIFNTGFETYEFWSMTSSGAGYAAVAVRGPDINVRGPAAARQCGLSVTFLRPTAVHFLIAPHLERVWVPCPPPKYSYFTSI